MKKQITKILLGASLLLSGQVMSQTDFIEKEPINISSIYHNNLLENFRVRMCYIILTLTKVELLRLKKVYVK